MSFMLTTTSKLWWMLEQLDPIIQHVDKEAHVLLYHKFDF